MKTVAVTGITGFTGSKLVEQLLKDGYLVNGLVRSPSEITRQNNLSLIEGGLADINAFPSLLMGVDTVFHIAAMYRSEGSYEEFYETNVKGTLDLLEASILAGVRRFIYCSTIGVHGNVSQTPANENAPFNPRDYYQETKLIAESACRNAHGKGIEVVIIRPCAIYGPGDTRMLKMFKMLKKGLFFYVGDAKPNFHPVYIDDLVQGFMLAMTSDVAAGETFIVGGLHYLPLRDYVASAARAINAPNPKFTFPYGLMHFLALSCELLCAPFQIQPPLHRRRLTFFKHNRAFDISKAQQLLGYKPRFDLDEGFELTVAWYYDNKLL